MQNGTKHCVPMMLINYHSKYKNYYLLELVAFDTLLLKVVNRSLLKRSGRDKVPVHGKIVLTLCCFTNKGFCSTYCMYLCGGEAGTCPAVPSQMERKDL